MHAASPDAWVGPAVPGPVVLGPDDGRDEAGRAGWWEFGAIAAFVVGWGRDVPARLGGMEGRALIMVAPDTPPRTLGRVPCAGAGPTATEPEAGAEAPAEGRACCHFTARWVEVQLSLQVARSDAERETSASQAALHCAT
jgi:hypothetical protein